MTSALIPKMSEAGHDGAVTLIASAMLLSHSLAALHTQPPHTAASD